MEAAIKNDLRGLHQPGQPSPAIRAEQCDEDEKIDAVDELLADGKLALLASFIELSPSRFFGLLILARHQSLARRNSADTPLPATPSKMRGKTWLSIASIPRVTSIL